MILRALFFAALLYVLAPREPDLGLGRPDLAAWLPSPSAVLSALGRPQWARDCGACTAALPRLPGAAPRQRGLADIKAEIKAAIAARSAAGG